MKPSCMGCQESNIDEDEEGTRMWDWPWARFEPKQDESSHKGFRAPADEKGSLQDKQWEMVYM